MYSAGSRDEAALLHGVLPQLEAEGFAVFVQPPRAMLPSFLSSYQPDAVAFKGERKIAVEVTSKSKQSDVKLARLRALFSEHSDWEFRVVYAPARNPTQAVPVLSRQQIEDTIARIPKAFDEIGASAALLIAWAAFEAAARSLVPGDLGPPQTPSRLLEVLASRGDVTPDDADTLRRLGQRRNEAAHGRLDVELTREELDKLVDCTRTMLSFQRRGRPQGKAREAR